MEITISWNNDDQMFGIWLDIENMDVITVYTYAVREISNLINLMKRTWPIVIKFDSSLSIERDLYQQVKEYLGKTVY